MVGLALILAAQFGPWVWTAAASASPPKFAAAANAH
jgi:hypothetical protein